MEIENASYYSLPRRKEAVFSFVRRRSVLLRVVLLLSMTPFFNGTLEFLLDKKKTEATRGFFIGLQQRMGRKISVLHRRAYNYAPKFVEYKIFLERESEDDVLARNVSGFGQSVTTNEEALSKATGEFLERYFLSKDWNGCTRIASSKELVGNVADFSSAPMFKDWQREAVANNYVTRSTFPDVKLQWVPTSSLFDASEKLVPAQRVFWMPDRNDQVGVINHPTTNGNAGGFSWHSAVMAGLYELIERDSFMFYWFMNSKPYVVQPGSIETPSFTSRREYLSRYDSEVYFLDMTTMLGVPVVTCLYISGVRTNHPKATIGAACGRDPERLFDVSFLEALAVQRYHWEQKGSKKIKDRPEGFFKSQEFGSGDFEQRILYWSGSDRVQMLKNLLCLGETVTYRQFVDKHKIQSRMSVPEELHYVKKRFMDLERGYGAGFHPYIYTHQDKCLEDNSYYVVSVVVPNLYPLHLVENLATLDIQTMLHWRNTASSQCIDWVGNILNKHPHPFP